jgi:hypothetical protein
VSAFYGNTSPPSPTAEMRLLNTETIELTEFSGNAIPRYAILSHTWGAEEVLLQDLAKAQVKSMKGYSKIKSCCLQAKQDGFEWVWIDTCCIDKSSSAELSEAINSMYQWYSNAHICYAFLADVPYDHPSDVTTSNAFLGSEWFRRGWTLQELIAPRNVEFYSANWTLIGSKLYLCEEIFKITGVSVKILRAIDHPRQCSTAQRMSWVANRKTTRIEDMAYCMMGLFDINMPLLYGEGTRAFIRLQEHILKQNEDYTLLIWQHMEPTGSFSSIFPSVTQQRLDILADSPRSFEFMAPRMLTYTKPTISMSRTISSMRHEPPEMTSRGVRICLPLRFREDGACEAWTYCLETIGRENHHLLCISLGHPYKNPEDRVDLNHARGFFRNSYAIQKISDREIAQFKPTTIYISQSSTGPDKKSKHLFGGKVSIVLPEGGNSISLKYDKPFPRWNRVVRRAMYYEEYSGPQKLPGYFLVALGFADGFIRCKIHVRKEEPLAQQLPLESSPEQITNEFHHLVSSTNFAWLSDRAFARLASGNIVGVICRNLGIGTYEPIYEVRIEWFDGSKTPFSFLNAV